MKLVDKFSSFTVESKEVNGQMKAGQGKSGGGILVFTLLGKSESAHTSRPSRGSELSYLELLPEGYDFIL